MSNSRNSQERLSGDLVAWIKEGNRDKVIAFLSTSDSREIKSPASIQSFLVAVAENQSDIVREFLSFGFPSNAELNKETGLLVASRRGFSTIVKLLLGDGANPNCRSSIDETPVIVACRFFDQGAQSHDYFEVLDALLASGGRLDDCDAAGETPLIHACENGNVDLVRWLLSRGVLPNRDTKEWNTPLHVACYLGNYEIAIMLLRYGARCDAVDVFNKTPLQVAAGHKHEEIERLLISFEGKSH